MLHWYVIGLCGLVVGYWMADPDVQGSNPVKSKNSFASVMLT